MCCCCLGAEKELFVRKGKAERVSSFSLVSSLPPSRQHAKIKSGKKFQVEVTYKTREKIFFRLRLFIALSQVSLINSGGTRFRINYLQGAFQRTG